MKPLLGTHTHLAAMAPSGRGHPNCIIELGYVFVGNQVRLDRFRFINIPRRPYSKVVPESIGLLFISQRLNCLNGVQVVQIGIIWDP